MNGVETPEQLALRARMAAVEGVAFRLKKSRIERFEQSIQHERLRLTSIVDLNSAALAIVVTMIMKVIEVQRRPTRRAVARFLVEGIAASVMDELARIEDAEAAQAAAQGEGRAQ